ncbi:hypothetical protein ZOSMA_230G00300 [Zostera marina]|uniref:Glycine-rich protein n=1 Tax=Zostera marina TaxID=29655 RepID=A0A0K9PIC3_ZOSMR|nr:hypothetical protein ZOSMA_230G00300 [Zostera marina]
MADSSSQRVLLFSVFVFAFALLLNNLAQATMVDGSNGSSDEVTNNNEINGNGGGVATDHGKVGGGGGILGGGGAVVGDNSKIGSSSDIGGGSALNAVGSVIIGNGSITESKPKKH